MRACRDRPLALRAGLVAGVGGHAVVAGPAAAAGDRGRAAVRRRAIGGSRARIAAGLALGLARRVVRVAAGPGWRCLRLGDGAAGGAGRLHPVGGIGGVAGSRAAREGRAAGTARLAEPGVGADRARGGGGRTGAPAVDGRFVDRPARRRGALGGRALRTGRWRYGGARAAARVVQSGWPLVCRVRVAWRGAARSRAWAQLSPAWLGTVRLARRAVVRTRDRAGDGLARSARPALMLLPLPPGGGAG